MASQLNFVRFMFTRLDFIYLFIYLFIYFSGDRGGTASATLYHYWCVTSGDRPILHIFSISLPNPHQGVFNVVVALRI